MQLTMDAVIARVPALPALPQVVKHILDSLADESANLEALSETIASDPAVAVRLLAAANSAAVGGQGVASLRQAMMLLGVGRVKQITVATAIIDRYKTPPPFDVMRLWRHSLGVAICAQDIARHAGVNTEAAYIAGLLHDIGELLLFATDATTYATVLQENTKGGRDLVAIEQEVLGLDHAQVGAELARRWNLPNDIVESIARHHRIDVNPPDSELADVVHVASALAYALELGTDTNACVPPLCDYASARMGIEWGQFARHFPGIEARYDGALLTLGL